MGAGRQGGGGMGGKGEGTTAHKVAVTKRSRGRKAQHGDHDNYAWCRMRRRFAGATGRSVSYTNV